MKPFVSSIFTNCRDQLFLVNEITRNGDRVWSVRKHFFSLPFIFQPRLGNSKYNWKGRKGPFSSFFEFSSCKSLIPTGDEPVHRRYLIWSFIKSTTGNPTTTRCPEEAVRLSKTDISDLPKPVRKLANISLFPFTNFELRIIGSDLNEKLWK